jgi:hypothetical protein
MESKDWNMTLYNFNSILFMGKTSCFTNFRNGSSVVNAGKLVIDSRH